MTAIEVSFQSDQTYPTPSRMAFDVVFGTLGRKFDLDATV